MADLDGNAATSELRVRRAVPGDTVRMWEITRGVWEGSDYVPAVWGRWLADARGTVMVATIAGRLVGLQHVDIQPDGVAWIEGIRVDESKRSAGIGAALLWAGLEWAAAAGCETSRLCTSSDTPASNRMALKAGMTLLDKLPVIRAPSDSSSPPAIDARVAGPEEFHEVQGFLEMHRPPERTVWIYTEGWTAYTLTSARLRLLLAMHAVVLAGTSRTTAIGIATSDIGRLSLRLGLLAGDAEGAAAIARWLRIRARKMGLNAVRASVVADDPIRQVLRRAGFVAPDDHAMLVYERVLSTQSSNARSVLQNASASQGMLSG